MRCRESQYYVSYPSEILDQYFSDAFGYELSSPHITPFPSGQPPLPNADSWLHGWNFSTSLYCILENMIANLHSRQPRSRPAPVKLELKHESAVSSLFEIFQAAISKYNDLDRRYKRPINEPRQLNGDSDSSNLQAVNISITLQLIHIVLCTAETGSNIAVKCSHAMQVLRCLREIPVYYLRAPSNPVLYHLTGVKIVLRKTLDGPLSLSSYLQIREVL